MKKFTLMAACLLVAGTAMAQRTIQFTYTVSDFSREMPCTNGRGEVIASQIGTVCLPYAPTLVEGATLYELYSASGEEWVFVSVSEPQPNTPYVYRVNDDAERVTFYGNGTYDRRQSEVKGAAAGVEDAFVGTYRSVVVNKPVYYLAGDKVCFTDQPINGTAFRCYFTADVMPEGETLSEDVRLTFTTPAALQSLLSEAQDGKVVIDRANIGLQQGEYQLGGQKVQVK